MTASTPTGAVRGGGSWCAGSAASLHSIRPSRGDWDKRQKVLEGSIADQAKGGQGNFVDHAQCLPAGMPFMMVATRPLEFVVTPDSTYLLVGGSDHYRRIFTDRRDWPTSIEASFSGYSIGRWIDQEGEGRYSLLEVETAC